MNKKLMALGALLLLGTGWYGVRRWRQPKAVAQKMFSTAQPTKTTIRHTISTTGQLALKDSSKVGSLVPGTVLEILVKKNDHVAKGQLLARLDNGKKDTAIRAAQGRLIQAQAEYTYANAIYEREKELFDAGHRSAQELEQYHRAMQVTHGSLISAQAARDVAQIEYDNTHIRAIDDGVIIAIGIKKGVKVTTDLNATVLFEIARDTTHMEAQIDIDESDVYHICPGQKVNFSVDCHDQKVFKARIRDVNYTPSKKGNNLVYKAMIDVDNSAHLLRPGMTIHATVKIDKAKDALGIDAQAFYLDMAAIKAVAQQLGYQCNSLSSDEKKKQRKNGNAIKYLWLHDGDAFIEKAITTGAHNNRYTQACDGISATDRYLTDIEQAGMFDKHYKKMFRGAL